MSGPDVLVDATALETAGLVEFDLQAPGVQVKLLLSPEEAERAAEELGRAAFEVRRAAA